MNLVLPSVAEPNSKTARILRKRRQHGSVSPSQSPAPSRSPTPPPELKPGFPKSAIFGYSPSP
eukprot:gene8772-7962_t